MFDKNLFNRNAFDRSVSSSAVSLSIISSGALKMQLVMRISLSVKPISGSSNMTCGILMQQHIGVVIAGLGGITNSAVNLSMALSPVRFSGSGKIVPGFSVKTPFRGNVGGTSTIGIDNRLYFLQQIRANINASGVLNTQFIMQSSISPITFIGKSEFRGNVSLLLPLSAEIAGNGEFTLRRLSAMNENILELINIKLLPGETVTIDTDLLQVLFGSKEDVSAVTSDSVFFELNPGENELLISTDSNSPLDVTAIWQNRWL